MRSIISNVWFKLIVLALALQFLTSCGIADQMSKDCGGDLELGCKHLFGDSSAEEQQDSRLDAIEAALQSQLSLNVVMSNQLQQNYNVLHAAISSLNSTDASLQQQLNATQASMITAQAQANSLQAQITQLSTSETVVDYLDCNGDGPGYDEVVLRLRSGKLLAYFENGSRRFLSLLTPGSYQTTDQSACNFTVTPAMNFCDALGCR